MPISTIRLMCPNLRCRSLLAVPTTARGKNVRCRVCGTRIQVPLKTGDKKPVPTTAEADATTEPAEVTESQG